MTEAWRRAAVAGLLWTLVLVAGLWPTVSSMVMIWWQSGTFNHAFAVPVIVAWLVWRSRADWQGLSPRVEWRWLLPAALLGMVLAVSEAALVNAPAHTAWVALWLTGVPLLLGSAVLRAWRFPVAYAFFMVPLGEFLLPQMMEWTADFTVAAVRASGVPVYREGLDFVIPSGHWSVVEACSGIRYLVASVCIGVLYAHLTYQSARKRWIFIAASVAVPLVANWLRAYLIVMLGHFSDNRLAAGVDHLIYGWVFFGLVIGALFWMGGRWADLPSASASMPGPEPTSVPKAGGSGTPLLPIATVRPASLALAVVAASVVGVAPSAGLTLSATREVQRAEVRGLNPTPGDDGACRLATEGADEHAAWQGTAPEGPDGTPAMPLWLRMEAWHWTDRSHRVAVGAPLPPSPDSAYKRSRRGPALSLPTQEWPVEWWTQASGPAVRMRGESRDRATDTGRRLVVQWLRIDGQWMTSGTEARWAVARSRLSGRAGAVQSWVVCTDLAPGQAPQAALASLQHLVQQVVQPPEPSPIQTADHLVRPSERNP